MTVQNPGSTLIAIVGLVVTRPSPRYFAVTKALRVIPLKPLSSPVMTKGGLELLGEW